MANNQPFTEEKQIDTMKKYVKFTKRVRMRRFLQYTGYFRASRYGKYLLSYTNVFTMKPSQDLLFELYWFDFELKKILYEACAKAELQIKSSIANAVSLKTSDATFYLDRNNYTPTRGERNKNSRNNNINFFNTLFRDIKNKEKNLRQNVLKYPELKEYRNGGKRVTMKIPSWAAFSYFEFGTIQNIYKYLRGDLRKEVLVYSYSKIRYGKTVTLHMDTWLNGIRTLRNICAHHSRLVGMKAAIVLVDSEDDPTILQSGEDLFSRLYALKKVMNPKDSEEMKTKVKKLITKTKINIYQLNILPSDWEDKFNRIKYL